jgi:alkyl hydroperoxide reductase subunit D
MSLDALRDSFPEAAKDIKLNLQSVLSSGSLAPAQRWGVAIASAVAARSHALRQALIEAARAEATEAVVDDALAAGALMAMNNVYYRFRHMMEANKPSYATRPARLRMNRLVNPKASKVDFELFSLAASAIGGCETCVASHEHAVIEGGLSEEQVHDAVRIASVINAAAVALEISGDDGRRAEPPADRPDLIRAAP